MLYKDLNTGETWTKEEIKEQFQMFRYEMETDYEDFDEYLEEKIKSGDLEEADNDN